MSIYNFPENLPITQKIPEIEALLTAHQVIIIAGETGSGKTTQIPKLCLKMGRGVEGKRIGHTQPRRIAARTVAARIAEELNVPLGSAIGYKIRFNDKTQPNTIIKVMTDGILLAETQTDPLLRQYDTIIIDEAHERTLNIDFLLGLLKKLLPQRPDLKLIITSATIDPHKFSHFFNGAPMIEVSGRTFPVETRYRPLIGNDENEQFIHQSDGILNAVDELSKLGNGDILVFLSGEREIRETAEALRKHHPKDTEILPLYSRLNAKEQYRVFEPHIGRRIILATNVAETSLTVPGVQFVIDTGFARISRYNYRTQVQRLPIEPISKASSNQRKGRCGRVRAGVCLRLYSEDDFLLRSEYTEPEILRTHLSTIILHMLTIGLGDIEKFPFLDPPDIRHIREGLKVLEQLGAITESRILTDLGWQLSKLPVDPKIGTMIIKAAKTGCLTEILIIASALSIQDPRDRPLERQNLADEKHAQFKGTGSDFLAYLKIWEFIHKNKAQLSKNKFRQLCQNEFLSFIRIQDWIDVHQQLHSLVKELGYRINEVEASNEAIHQALLTGLIAHIGNITEKNGYLGLRNTKFQIFPGSELFKKPPKWVVAFELIETQRVYARTNAKILPEWIESMAGHLIKIGYREPHWEKKAGHVMAFAKGTLYGLTVFDSRKVIYGKIDPKLSRDIFIRSALVDGEYQTDAKFFHENRNLIESIKNLEHKSRRRDILVDEHLLFQFYNNKIPEDIYNRPLFEQWLKSIDPNFLIFTEQDLVQSNVESINHDNYPNEILVNGLTLSLSYHFEPNHPEDGTTVTIPVGCLKQMSVEPFDWLVPGFLKEKVSALLRNLPKVYRKHFVPIPDYAAAVTRQLIFRNGNLTEEISKILTQISGIVIQKEAWDLTSLPEHLKMNFSVVDSNGKRLKQSRNLSKLIDELTHDVILQPDLNIERSQIVGWDFEKIPATVEIKQAGVTLNAYPALVDNKDSVSLKLMLTQEDAQISHMEGIRRLILLTDSTSLKYWIKNIPNLNTTALQFFSIYSKQELMDDLISAAVDAAYLDENITTEITTSNDFTNCLINGRTKIGSQIRALANLTARISEVYQRLLRLPNRSVVEQQLKHLIYKGFIIETPNHWLTRFPIYLEAIEQRLTKLRAAPDKDKKLEQELKIYWERCLQPLENPKAHAKTLLNPEWINFRWMVEEFRISLFAQSLRTSLPISAKRLNSQWEAFLKNSN